MANSSYGQTEYICHKTKEARLVVMVCHYKYYKLIWHLIHDRCDFLRFIRCQLTAQQLRWRRRRWMNPPRGNSVVYSVTDMHRNTDMHKHAHFYERLQNEDVFWLQPPTLQFPMQVPIESTKPLSYLEDYTTLESYHRDILSCYPASHVTNLTVHLH